MLNIAFKREFFCERKFTDPQLVNYNQLFVYFFRRQEPVTFEGDLTNDEAILNWLTSQEVFSLGDEIEEVNRKMLEKLLEENDFVAVYFCKLFYVKSFQLTSSFIILFFL